MTRRPEEFYSIACWRKGLLTVEWEATWWPEITRPGRFPAIHKVGRGVSVAKWVARLAGRRAIRRHKLGGGFWERRGVFSEEIEA